MTRPYPVLSVIAHAVRTTYQNLGAAFKISWPWMALALTVSVASFILEAQGYGGESENPSGLLALGFFLASLAQVFVITLGFSAVAVNWHRYILLKELPHGSTVLRVDNLVWRYLGNFLLIVSVMVLIVFFVSSALGQRPGSPGAGHNVVVRLMTGVFLLPLFYRATVKLPAIAVGGRDFGFRQAWVATEGNFSRLMILGLITAVSSLLYTFADEALSVLLVSAGGSIGSAAAIGTELVMNWISEIFGIAILTANYQFFVEEREF
jgi:hypothetical protein